jgi:hypothetical protein
LTGITVRTAPSGQIARIVVKSASNARERKRIVERPCLRFSGMEAGEPP